VIESLSMIRLVKLTRYYEGSHLIYRAVARSLSQLLVPLFMLLIMIFFFSVIMYELELDTTVEFCCNLWRQQGVSTAFIEAHPDGVGWGCEVCEFVSNITAPNDDDRLEFLRLRSAASRAQDTRTDIPSAWAWAGCRRSRTCHARCGSQS
jgi:hypothetical protein